MALANIKSKSNAYWIKPMKRGRRRSQFAICICNSGYEASLEPRKLYLLVRDAESEARGLLRVVDESGEDYLYPRDFFLQVNLSKPIEYAVATI